MFPALILSAALLTPSASQAPRPPQAPPVEGFRWVVAATATAAPAAPARATPKVARKAASCPCSPACTCGCQEGLPCQCPVTTTTARPAPVIQYAPALPMAAPLSYAPAPSMGWGGFSGGFSGGRSAGGC